MRRATQLTDKEVRIIDIIRRADFCEVRVIKKDGEPTVLHVRQNPVADDEITTDDLTDLIERRQFSDIVIKKRNGKVVYVDEDMTIKL